MLLEVKIYLVRIRKLDEMIKELKTVDLGFRVRIAAGERFWIATPFVKPKNMEKTAGLCDFKLSYRIRVDLLRFDTVTVSLWVCPIENGRLPDVLESLKKERSLGFTRLRLTAVPEQKKVLWIPLNNETYPDKPFSRQDDPMISLNYRLLRDVPGNFPEVPLSGKQFSVGDIVCFIEKLDLSYPSTEAEFSLLHRPDIVFDPSRANTAGTPLRTPATAKEWRIADLDPEAFKAEDSSQSQAQSKVPFMFRMPKDKETFENLRLPGDYGKLKKKGYKVGDVVKELDSVEAKQVCILRGIDTKNNCYMTRINESDSEGIVIKARLGCNIPLEIEENLRSDRRCRRRSIGLRKGPLLPVPNDVGTHFPRMGA